MDNIGINFLEFLYLVESCLPPRSTAKEVFFDKLSDEYYHRFDNVHRDRLLGFVRSRRNFDLSNSKIAHFVSRYDPLNQYRVLIKGDRSNHWYVVYLYNGNYHFSKDRVLRDEDIESVIRSGVYE